MKIWKFILLLNLIVGLAYSQAPANADCENAVILSSSATCTLTQGTNVGVDFSTYDNCDFYKYMVWYKFKATASSHLIQVKKGSIANYHFDAFENNCGSLSRVSSCDYSSYNSDHDFGISGLTIGDSTTGGDSILIAISTTNESDAGTFEICIGEIQAPVNDDCSGALALTVNAGNSPTVRTEGSTAFASQSQAACSGNAQDDVWYSFTASQTSHRLFFKTLSFSGSPVIQVFSGNCNALTSQQCFTPSSYNSDNSFTLLSNLNIGDTYFIRVHNNIGTGFGGTFSLGIASLVAPPNDDCSGSIAIIPASDFSQSVGGSTLDATLSQASCFSGPYADDDVWYQFTSTQKVHRIKVKGMTSNAGRIEVYRGSCGALVPLDCSAPIISGDTIIKEQTGLEVGATYFFRVYTFTFAPSYTSFQVAVTNPYISLYDNCEGALTIPVSANETCTPTNFSFAGAFKSINTPNCGSFVVQNDIYLKFTATAKQHQIKVSPHTYVSGQIYSGACGSQTLMLCDAFGSDSLVNLGGLQVGAEYTIRLLQQYNNSPELQICITTPSYAANDEVEGAQVLAISGDQYNCQLNAYTLDSSAQSLYTTCNASTNSRVFDKWYKFTATAAMHRLYLLTGSGSFLNYELFTGSETSLTYVSCSSNIATSNYEVLENLVPAQTYFIRIYSFLSAKSDFQLCLSEVGPPENDECSSASTLQVYNTWLTANYTNGSTSGANRTMESNNCGAANSHDVWYKFTATNSSHWIGYRNGTLGQAISGLTVAVYSGSCASRVFKVCKVANFTNQNDEKLQVNGLTIGNEYFIKVYSSTANTSTQGTFSIQVLDLGQPANDNCDAATPLSIQINSNNFSYLSDVNLLATSSSQAISCSVSGTADDDLWYSFKPGSTSVKLLLTADFKNLAYVVYSGSCGTLSSVSCGSAGASAFSVNTILDNLNPSTEYKIRLFSVSSTQKGRVFIALTNDTQGPANDSCQNAVSLLPSATNQPEFLDGNTINARSTNSLCVSMQEVWYKFEATATEHGIVYDGYIKDPAITAFSGGCANLSTLPNACFGGTHGIAFSSSGLTIGETYYLKVGSQTRSAATQGNFKIAITSPTIPPNDACAGAIALTNVPTYYSASKASNEFILSTECGNFGKDVWFKFTASKNRMSIDLENLNTDALMGVYEGACSNLQLIKCSLNNSSTQRINILNLEDLVIGNEYLVNVAAFSSSAFLEFRISAFENDTLEANSQTSNTCIGTNLVSNPSFEDLQVCPSGFVGTPASPGQWLSPELGWTIPSMGSADYFNACATYNASIETPRNHTFGFQTPRNGMAYAGFFAGGSSYREYLHTALESPMEIGKKYVLSMYVSRSDYYPKASNNIGFGLSEGSVIQHNYDTLSVDKILIPVQNTVIHEKDDWVNISIQFTADKPYKHLYLGNFHTEAFTLTEPATDISGGQSGGYSGSGESPNAYYFVDDVFVGEVQNIIACGASDCNSILVLNSPTDDISSASVNKTSNLEIKANITIQGNSNVLLSSGKYIEMDAQNGVFEVKSGVVFEAKIGGCEN